jgi:hypothetical protein
MMRPQVRGEMERPNCLRAAYILHSPSNGFSSCFLRIKLREGRVHARLARIRMRFVWESLDSFLDPSFENLVHRGAGNIQLCRHIQRVSRHVLAAHQQCNCVIMESRYLEFFLREARMQRGEWIVKESKRPSGREEQPAKRGSLSRLSAKLRPQASS